MAAAASSMDHHDRRLSVNKSSSSKISKPSALRPPSAPSTSRPPATVVSADLYDFCRVVQQLTGMPLSSASSSPVLESTRSSRLRRMAPPSLRPFLHQQELQRNQQPLRPHQDDDQPLQHGPSSVGLFSPPLPYTQVENFNQNTDSNFNAHINRSPLRNPNSLLLSPHQFAVLRAKPTPSNSMWANLLHAIPSPRPLSNSAGLLPPLYPLRSASAEDVESGCVHSSRKDLECRALSVPSSNGSPLLPPPSNGHALLSSTLDEHPLQLPPSSNGLSLLPFPLSNRPLLGSSSNGYPFLSSSSSNEQSLHGPLPQGGPLLPSPHAALPPLLPVSPSNFLNSWLPPWPPSPLLPLPFSPGLLPPSPGLAAFMSSPARGFSGYGTDDHQSSSSLNPSMATLPKTSTS